MEELSVSQAHVEFQKQQQQVAMTIPNGQEKSQNNRYSSGNCIHYHPEHNL
ncbi:14991_t:CDS:2 [Rhizophagus irregularis]|nr:14991_t:CDS:2 [Rhizophagus irregularis]